MTSRLEGDRGEFSLVGLMTAVVLSLVVMGATLSIFSVAQVRGTELTSRNDAQQEVRTASDRMAQALRNLASPTPDQPQAVDRATAQDLVFQSVDPAGPNAGANVTNVRRDRWCLGASGKLYAQGQTWTTAAVPAVPSTATCPGSGWTTTQVAAEHITNAARPIFTFDSLTLTDISAVHVDLFFDEDPGTGPSESHLTTGVFLRNQNRRPSASFTATPTPRGIVLNASASADPEGQPLSYIWLDAGVPVDTGVTATYVVTAGTQHTLSVRVADPAGLTSTSATQTVTG